ncbi:diguanylate cyclase [Petrotoga mobilis SJ95]|uniref:Diguanylate cyclase n=2 Tax=Petrotoga TaxID=28236 RepID=A9BI72_PETMO|nr:diguanylate cyclase [Petrotoga mobilis SJ95]
MGADYGDVNRMNIKLLEKYQSKINSAYVNPGITLLLENFTKEVLFDFEVTVKIHSDPLQVPDNLYKLIKIFNSFSIFTIKNIEETNLLEEQKVELKSFQMENIIEINYETLKKEESMALYETIKNASSLVGSMLTDILLNSSKIANVFRASRIILEKGYKPGTSIDEMIYITMTAITGGFAGGFNRAILFVEDSGDFKVHRVIGPENEMEAHKTYEKFETLETNIDSYLSQYEFGMSYFSNLEKRIKGIIIKKELLIDNDLFKYAVESHSTIKLPVSRLEEKIVNLLDLRGEIAISPIEIEDEKLAFYLCDNRYNGKPITDDQIEILDYYAKESGVMWQNKIYQSLLKKDAQIDSLTEIGNRRSYENYISSIKYLKNQKIALVVLDLDNFKKVNDTYGHEEGDSLLKKFAQLCVDNLRKKDNIFRYGGDEFVIILGGVKKEEVYSILERINSKLKQETNVTFSAGVAYGESHEIDSLFNIADENLYIAKGQGKNNIIIT